MNSMCIKLTPNEERNLYVYQDEKAIIGLYWDNKQEEPAQFFKKKKIRIITLYSV